MSGAESSENIILIDSKHFKPHCVSVHFQQALAKLKEQVLHWLRIRKDVENACR